MAIIKRSSAAGTSYQVKLRGTDGRWITETVERLRDAEQRERELKNAKVGGQAVTSQARQISVKEFFVAWDKETRGTGVSAGWRSDQIRIFRDYVEPVIGSVRLQAVTPALIARVLTRVQQLGRGSAMQRHVYVLMHQVFEAAVELFELLPRNPVLRKLRPKLPERESRYLELGEVERLVRWVKGKRHETTILLQLLGGLRVGEAQALRWDCVDLERGLLHVRATYRRKEKRLIDHPKGKKWHSLRMPPELWERLREISERSGFVVRDGDETPFSYYGYQKTLRRYCREAGLPDISTHGLRHSTSEIYMANGASRDDLRVLFAHTTSSVTDRYVHDQGKRLENVANVIRLVPKSDESGQCSQNVPKSPETGSATDCAESRQA